MAHHYDNHFTIDATIFIPNKYVYSIFNLQKYTVCVGIGGDLLRHLQPWCLKWLLIWEALSRAGNDQHLLT